MRTVPTDTITAISQIGSNSTKRKAKFQNLSTNIAKITVPVFALGVAVFGVEGEGVTVGATCPTTSNNNSSNKLCNMHTLTSYIPS